MSSIFDTFPKYFKSSIQTVSETGCLCVITFWTRKEEVYERLSEYSDILCIGNLYTENGIQYIVKNSLLCPQIRGFILFGNDKNNVGPIFESQDYYYSKDDNFRLFYDTFIAGKRVFHLNDLSEIKHIIHREVECKLDDEKHPWIDSPIDCYEETMQDVDSFPSEHQGFTIRDDSLERLWHKALSHIKRFGIEKETKQGKKYREILGLVSILECDNNPLKMPNNAPLSENIEAYSTQIITDTQQPGIEYTYGQRLYEHGQIDAIIEKLNADPANRQAIGVTWNLPKDATSQYPPCCVLADFKIQSRSINGKSEDVLYMTLYFRSHDIYSAYCANIYGFRRLQIMIASVTNTIPGYIMVISNSAHVYEYDYEAALKYDELGCRLDPRGYFIIETIIDHETINTWLNDYAYHVPVWGSDENNNEKNAINVNKIPCEYIDWDKYNANDKYEWFKCRLTFKEYVAFKIYACLKNDDVLSWKYLRRKPGLIKLTYMSPTDQPITERISNDVHELCDFAMPFISELSHALYIGRELQRAKNCIDNGVAYKQP